MRVTPYACPQIIGCLAVVAAGIGLAGWAFWRGWQRGEWMGAEIAVLLIFGLWVLLFFRNPARTIPAGEHLLVAPADGVVTHVDRVASLSVAGDGQTPAPHAFMPGEAQRVSIFLSVFDVHLNRAPLAGKVVFKEYRRGAFFDARREESHGKNERMDIGIEPGDPGAPRVVIRQLSGLIARRIVCVPEPGDVLERGQTYGMIKFGSRTSLFVPADAQVEWRVKPGDKVRAGETILGVYTQK